MEHLNYISHIEPLNRSLHLYILFISSRSTYSLDPGLNINSHRSQQWKFDLIPITNIVTQDHAHHIPIFCPLTSVAAPGLQWKNPGIEMARCVWASARWPWICVDLRDVGPACIIYGWVRSTSARKRWYMNFERCCIQFIQTFQYCPALGLLWILDSLSKFEE